MIKGGQQKESKPINDAMTCPSCGSPLTCSNGVHKCTSCDYQVAVIEIDYSLSYNHLCMICGKCLTEDELQICQKCKEKMLNNWRNQNG